MKLASLKSCQNPERSAVARNEGATDVNISLYSSLDGSSNIIATFDEYHDMGEKEVGEHTKLEALASRGSWRTKYHIGAGIEIYHGANINSNPHLPGAIVFFEGFLRAGIRLLLFLLVVFFFNYIGRAPQQFMTTYFIARAVFDCLNSHKDYGNGELKLEYFLNYYQVARSSSNNRTRTKASSSKTFPKKGKGRATKVAKGKGAADPSLVNPNYYKI